MQQLLKPKKLQRGDKIATISLSWGGAGELPHRYQIGKERLQDIFGLKVVETKHALKSAQWIYENPQARAEDLMDALCDTSIKAIISNIGGDDSIRLLPYIDLEIIHKHPKIFLGFSDSTVTHFMFLKAGVSSFCGTSLLVGFAENGTMHKYQIEDIERTLFSTDIIGKIYENTTGWTSERVSWQDVSLQHQVRQLEKHTGWNFLNGKGKVQGRLIGGCIEVLEFLKGTSLWLNSEEWKDTILFLETSEDMPHPNIFKWWLRNYAAQGILKNCKGIILGRPYDNSYVQEYNKILLDIIVEEEKLIHLPIITEMDFGHTCPVFTLPYGAMAELNMDDKSFSILESGVI